MKKDIHPEYREVLFHDSSADKYWIIRSTLETTETKKWEDGNTYPYFPLDISSASHPFYTGTQKIIDTGGSCLLYTSPSPRDRQKSRMPSSA